MIHNFENITKEQLKVLTDAITWITILIGGADGNLEKDEKDWAAKLSKVRSYSNDDTLHEFYKEVGKDFTEVLESELEYLPGDVENRSNILVEKLASVNPILAQLDHHTAKALYESYKSFAKHVAHASGGFFDFFTVSYAEEKWLELPMIEEI